MKNLTVVLGEDDDGHALLVRKNLERVGLVGSLVRLCDGREVIEYFRREAGNRAGGPKETLLLLDINMPQIDGIEVLRLLREDPATSHLPVIMLTTTDNPREIARCYELGCNIYVTKPIVYEQFVDAITRLGMFLTVVRVPENGGSAS
ncbi:MAG: response regulator [Planctomycetota bacterium]